MLNLLGAINLFPYTRGTKISDGGDYVIWIKCDGRSLKISEYPALFDLIKTKYGGDGVTTFCIPDLQTYSDETKTKSVPPYHFICVKGVAPADYDKGMVDLLVGCFQFFAFDFVPKGFTKCEGQNLNINEDRILYSLFSNKFGGSERQGFFSLPNLREVKVAGHSLNCCMANTGLYPNANASGFTIDTFSGMIMPFAYRFPFNKCNGATLSIGGHSMIFSLLGTAFGGDGVSNFKLPNIPPIKVKCADGTVEDIVYAIELGDGQGAIYPTITN